MVPPRGTVPTFLEAQGVVVIDGGMATELEHAGYDLSDSLWSARLLLEAPHAIEKVHRLYLEAGADCIISASYQATIEGFQGRGASETEAVEAIGRSVSLAVRARETFWSQAENREGRLKPLVAAGVGPYGASLADGSEYTGSYDLDEAGLLNFHRRRWQILAASDADLLCCETVPSLAEGRVLAGLLADTPDRVAWISFSCRDGEHISDGTPIAQCVSELRDTPGLVAIGVNCTRPRYVPELISRLRDSTDLPIVVYPNSGESWQAEAREWTGCADAESFAAAGREWFAAGARLIGGCCRTRPETIRQLRASLLPSPIGAG